MTATVTERALWRFAIEDVPVALAVAAGLVAAAGAEGRAVLHDPGLGAAVTTLTLDGGLLSASFAPNGERLMLTGPGGYLLWRRDAAAPITVPGPWSARAAWAGDDRVAVAAGRAVYVLDGAGAPQWRTGDAPSTVTDLAWIRGGREIAVSAYNGVARYAPHSPAPVATLDYPGSHLCLAVSPDGKWLCTGNQDASVHLWRVRDGKELEMAGFPEKVTATAFDHTGRWMANNGAPEATVWDFSGRGPGGSMPRILKAHDAVSALAWRPGKAAVLATGGREGQLALWDVPSARAGKDTDPIVALDLGAPVTALAWLDDARLVAGTRTGEVICLPAAQTLHERGFKLR